MGEYIFVRGEHDTRKLGTCESLFYVRYADLRRWVQEGRAERVPGNAEPAAYLDPANGFRFRFPFPDEDAAPWHALHYDRGVRLAAPACVFEELEPHGPPRQVTRYTVGNAAEPLPGICPNADAAAGQGGPVELVAQRPMADGRLWAVVRCPFCGDLWRLTPERAAALAEHNAAADPAGALDELLQRLLDGYAEGAAR